MLTASDAGLGAGGYAGSGAGIRRPLGENPVFFAGLRGRGTIKRHQEPPRVLPHDAMLPDSSASGCAASLAAAAASEAEASVIHPPSRRIFQGASVRQAFTARCTVRRCFSAKQVARDGHHVVGMGTGILTSCGD